MDFKNYTGMRDLRCRRRRVDRPRNFMLLAGHCAAPIRSVVASIRPRAARAKRGDGAGFVPAALRTQEQGYKVQGVVRSSHTTLAHDDGHGACSWHRWLCQRSIVSARPRQNGCFRLLAAHRVAVACGCDVDGLRRLVPSERKHHLRAFISNDPVASDPQQDGLRKHGGR